MKIILKKLLMVLMGMQLLLLLSGCKSNEQVSEQEFYYEQEIYPVSEEKFEIEIAEDPSLRNEYELNNHRLTFVSQKVEADLTRFPEAEKAVESYFPKKAQELYSEQKNNYKAAYTEVWDKPEDIMTDQCYAKIQTERLDSQVLSFCYGGSFFRGEGTLYNNTYYEGVVFDTVSGKRLALEDVVKDVDKFIKFAKSYVTLSVYHDEQLMEWYSDQYNMPEINLELENDRWYFSNDGIIIICNPSEKDIYTVIEEQFTIPYGAVIDYLKPKYLPENVQREQLLKAKKTDFVELFQQSSDITQVAMASGLDWTEEWGDSVFYTAFEDSVQITVLASAPKVNGVRMDTYVEGLSIGGCTIGMTLSECVEKFIQMGFDAPEECGYGGRIQMFKEDDLAAVSFYVISDIVVSMDYGIFLGEDEWYPELY